MCDLMTWLLVVYSLIAVAMVAYRNGVRPLVPMRTSWRSAHAVHTWSRERAARTSS